MAKKQDNGTGITLSDVLGAILKDVTESRHLSDKYSRDLSRNYEIDDILKTYPVPRTEIKELDIDLKFAFKEAVEVETEAEILRRRVLHLFLIYKSIISNKIIDIVKSSFIDKLKKLKEDNKKEKEEINQIIKKIESSEFYNQLSGYIFDILNWSLKFWTFEKKTIESRLKSFSEFSSPESDTEKPGEKELKFDVQKLIDHVLSLLINGYGLEWIGKDEKITDRTTDQRGKIYEPILGEDLFKGQFGYFNKEILNKLRYELWNIVQDMRNRFEHLNKELRQINAYIKIKSSELQELDNEKLCSVSIKTVIKNYLWTEVDENTNRLIPE